MTKPLTTQTYYNICRRDDKGILWAVVNNYTEDQVKGYLGSLGESLCKDLVVIAVETCTFDVSEKFKWKVFDDNNGNKGE